jgi:hypothetical protein
MTQEQTGETCWQCGAPADPYCVYTQNLVNRSRYADGLGHPVKSNARSSSVKISIPRCETCQIRNYLVQALMIGGFLIGACIGGLQFPSRGITTIIGGVAGLIPGALVLLYHRRINGLRSIEDYPPLRQLRAAGWEDPN